MIRKTTAFVVAAAALVAVPAAWGHVTVNPNEVPAGSFARFDLRVPNEEQSADTTKVTVQLPEGLLFTSFQPKAGWTRTVTMKKLDKPVTSDDGTVTERIDTVTWSGGKIAPGEFDEFGFSAKVPDTEGTVLVFPAVQTYSDGHVARWIGSADADEPAPRVTLAAAEGDHHSTTTTTAASSSESSHDDSESRANVALVLGAAGLAAGLGALGLVLAGRRRA
ncbi:MAG: YcnI family protein [Solirubrobacteraceae bacterium]